MMIETVLNLFVRREPRREAGLALARIISRYDMMRMSFEEGISDNRRDREERHVALGVWLFPWQEGRHFSLFEPETGVPAVTHDIRAEGFGIMMPVPCRYETVLVATPEDDGSGWRFFECTVRHNTRRSGGWHQLGVQVNRAIEIEGVQRKRFREHIASAHAIAGDEQ